MNVRLCKSKVGVSLAAFLQVAAATGCIGPEGSPTDLAVFIELDQPNFDELKNVSGIIGVKNTQDKTVRAEIWTCPAFWLQVPDVEDELVLQCPIADDRDGPRPKTVLHGGEGIDESFRLSSWVSVYPDEDLPPGPYGISTAMVRDGVRSPVVMFELTG